MNIYKVRAEAANITCSLYDMESLPNDTPKKIAAIWNGVEHLKEHREYFCKRVKGAKKFDPQLACLLKTIWPLVDDKVRDDITDLAIELGIKE